MAGGEWKFRECKKSFVCLREGTSTQSAIDDRCLARYDRQARDLHHEARDLVVRHDRQARDLHHEARDLMVQHDRQARDLHHEARDLMVQHGFGYCDFS